MLADYDEEYSEDGINSSKVYCKLYVRDLKYGKGVVLIVAKCIVN